MKRGRIAVLWEQWHYFNKRYFGGKLIPPRAIRLTSARSYDGTLYFKGNAAVTHFHLAHDTKICLSTHQTEKALYGTLLHEMVHQYQLQVWKVDPGHDARFKAYCRWIERQTNFQLRVSRMT